VIPISSRFFTSVASYLDSERPIDADVDHLFVVLKGPRRGRPVSGRVRTSGAWADEPAGRAGGCGQVGPDDPGPNGGNKPGRQREVRAEVVNKRCTGGRGVPTASPAPGAPHSNHDRPGLPHSRPAGMAARTGRPSGRATFVQRSVWSPPATGRLTVRAGHRRLPVECVCSDANPHRVSRGLHQKRLVPIVVSSITWALEPFLLM